MTDQTTATTGTPSSDTSAQSTAAAATTTAAKPAADATTTATQQKPADSTTTKAADATATPPAKDGDKPADKPEGDTTKVAPTDAEKAATDKAAKDAADAEAAKNAPKGAPEKYEAFTLPDGVKIAPEVEAKVTATAKEFNLPQEGAQKLVNAAIDLQKSFSTQMDAKITAIRQEWVTTAKADKEFGGDNFDVNLAIANTAVRAFGSPAFKQLLKDSGVGDHPEFIRTFLNIGKSISQDSLVSGGDGVTSESASGFATAASKLYGGKQS